MLNQLRLKIDMADNLKAHYPGKAPIDAYGDGGFRFAEMSHVGHILCLPNGIFSWDLPEMPNPKNLALDHFAKVLKQSEQIDVFFFGCGTDLYRLPPSIREAFSNANIILESMNTGAAARTYNVMLLEGRQVACGLVAVSG